MIGCVDIAIYDCKWWSAYWSIVSCLLHAIIDSFCQGCRQGNSVPFKQERQSLDKLSGEMKSSMSFRPRPLTTDNRITWKAHIQGRHSLDVH